MYEWPTSESRDFNLYVTETRFSIGSAWQWSNSPVTAGFGTLIVLGGPASNYYALQLFVTNGADIYFRFYNSSTFTAWKSITHS